MRRWSITTLSVLGVHLLLGAATVAAQDPSEAPVNESDIRPIPGGGLLEAGTYTSSAVGPGTTFSVSDGWAVVYPAVGGQGFAIGPTSGGHLLGLIPFDGTVTDEPCFTTERMMDLHEAEGAMSAWLADSANLMTVDVSIEGFWSHLEANPYLTIGELEEVEIGGFSGLQADISTTVAEECFPRETILWVEPTHGAWILKDGAEARYAVLDVAGTVVVIAAESAPGLRDHEARLELDDVVLETLTFTSTVEGEG